MTRQATPASQQQRSLQTDTLPRSGPTPIDPADFKFIGGGAPRHGWSAPLATDTETFAVTASPRHGW